MRSSAHRENKGRCLTVQVLKKLLLRRVAQECHICGRGYNDGTRKMAKMAGGKHGEDRWTELNLRSQSSWQYNITVESRMQFGGLKEIKRAHSGETASCTRTLLFLGRPWPGRSLPSSIALNVFCNNMGCLHNNTGKWCTGGKGDF